MKSLLLFFALLTSALAAPFEIRNGDRVLILGDTLLEREGTFGNLETQMHLAFPAAHFTVRNLAYSADNPLGWSRASFDPAPIGLERLKEQIASVNPTVCILGYGMASSLDALYGNDDSARYGPITRGAAGVAEFQKQLGALMDSIQSISAKAKPDAKVRFILLSPIRHEDLRATRPGLPDPATHNALLEKYTAAIGKLAAERGATFVNIFQLGEQAQGLPRTDNGIHPNAAGHRAWAGLVSGQLGWAQNDSPALRAAILEKNDYFFHRWRPANHTYIFGFRKGEQGRNAVEIPQFDPLIEASEVAIDRIKQSPGGQLPVAEIRKAEPAPEAAKLALPNFTVADGMELTLWAETPLLSKPVGMNWDARGRLWVACSPVYPMITPGAHPDDKVVILEDTDHDGKADKTTTFASDLLIAASVAPVFQKVPENKKTTLAKVQSAYVAASTDLFLLTDSNRDDQAETRRRVLSGFGTEDTHHTLHTLRWGPDGLLYMNQSIYTHSHIETPWGVVRLNSGGIYAYDPQTERLEVHARGWCNPWGHVWDKAGQEFVTDGAGSQGISWLVPGAMYFTYENAKKILQSISPGGYPKFASLEIIRSPLFPADWQGTAITCDFRAHRVVRFAINDLREGETPKSGYITKALPDVIRTDDATFRPIDLKLGPDGALYIADWSNPIINHGEVDFRDPRRDHVNGRIWRLAPKGQAPLAWGSLSPIPAPVMPKGRDPAEAPTLIKDPSPRVRLEAMRALAKNPTVANAALVLEAALAAPEGDPYYSYAAWLSINDLAEAWTAALASGAWQPDTAERQRQLAWGLTNIPANLASKSVSATLAKNGLPRDGSGPWIELIGRAGDKAALQMLLNRVAESGFDIERPKGRTARAEGRFNEAAGVRALNALADAARLRNLRPGGPLTHAAVLIHSDCTDICTAAARLAGLWKLPEAAPLLESLAKQPDAAQRAAAFDGFLSLGGEPAVAALKRLLRSDFAPVPPAAFAVLAQVNPDAALAELPAVLGAVKTGQELLAAWRGILQSKDALGLLERSLPKDLPKPAIAAGIRAARERGRGAEKLAAALTKLSGETVVRDVKADIRALVASIPTKGNPANGEVIYHRIGCTACHSIGGAGGKFGPDFTSLGASAPLDYIVESVLDPTAKVKEGYIAFSFTMKDGSQTVGIPTRETENEQFIRPGPGIETPIAKANIVKRESMGSLMPPGLIDSLKEQEKQDLLAFLTQLGRPGPFDTTKPGLARTWSLFAGSDLAKITPPGILALTLADGRLPKETITTLLPKVTSILAQTTFTNDTQLKTRFQLVGITRAYLDGTALAIASNPNPEITLSPGRHTLTVQFDTTSLPPAISLMCPDVNFLNE